MINVAYLLMCHKEPEQIMRLCNLLVKTGDVYVHVDMKSDMLPFRRLLGGIQHVFIFENRINVSYAGWTMAKVYLEMLDYAYHQPKNYDRFVFMTGQDYPIMSDREITAYFENNQDVEMVMAYNIINSTITTDKNKIQHKWFLDFSINNKFLRRVYKSFMYRTITKHGIKRDIHVPLNRKMVDPYFGQMLSAFTREGAKLLIYTYRNDKKFNRVMKHVYPTVEIYWQTIIFNSKLRDKTSQHGEEHEITEHFGWAPLHYHHYEVDTSIFTEEDYEEVINSGYMFCRKVVQGKSDKLMDMVDDYRKSK